MKRPIHRHTETHIDTQRTIQRHTKKYTENYKQSTYWFVPPHPVVIHDRNDQTRLPNLLVGHSEHEGLVKDWIEVLFLDLGLLLLHFLAIVGHPDFDVGIWKEIGFLFTEKEGLIEN